MTSTIGRVASVLAELLCIGRVCRSYESDSFSCINTVLLIVLKLKFAPKDVMPNYSALTGFPSIKGKIWIILIAPHMNYAVA